MKRFAAVFTATLLAPGLGAAPAPVTKGLTFALSFDGSGRTLISGPFALKVPGTKKCAVTVSFDSVGLIGGMLDAPIRVKSACEADLLAVRVDLTTVTESVRSAGTPSPSRAQNVSPPPPLAWDRIAAGAETPADIFRGGPLAFSPETEVVVVLGVVSGLAVETADPKKDVRTPATKASACPGQSNGCRIDSDRNVWRLEPAAEGRRGGLSERGPEGGEIRSLRFEEGARPVDLALAPDGRLLVFFDDGSSDGAVRAFRPF